MADEDDLKVAVVEKLQAMADIYQGVQSVVRVSTNEGGWCAICEKTLSGHDDFDGAVNHLIGHGYRVLHIGTETEYLSEGLGHSTIAVLGK